ncbi:Proline synthase co-transcribed bacterial homolog protein [Galdieria sulphuraria]|nr:Proline synthase co-transcribed bacterial homolog protein [Galdieria sulphuraria]
MRQQAVVAMKCFNAKGDIQFNVYRVLPSLIDSHCIGDIGFSCLVCDVTGSLESCWILLSYSFRVWYSSPRRPFRQYRIMCTTVNTFPEKEREQGLVKQALCGITEQVQRICVQCGRGNDIPRLVAVSKTKPPSLIMEAYDAGHRHFGENYVQELVEKAAALPKDIRWHFIGHLQSNKGRSCRCAGKTVCEKTKSGCSAIQVVDLARHILETCPHLSLKGFMTIGRPDVSQVVQDFETLKSCRDKVEKECQQNNLELSMGMSNDWKEAVIMGSNNIRIGSALFGERQRKK